uniref:Uncharacterized protein n=1 Tax=Oryza rufipogon TaxID=4529 RepID=A0A0E0NE18_ORYRU
MEMAARVDLLKAWLPAIFKVQDPGCRPGQPRILTVPAAIAIAILRARSLVLPDQEACQDHAGTQTAQSMNLQFSQYSGAVVSTAMADDGIAAVTRRYAARFIIQDITTQKPCLFFNCKLDSCAKIKRGIIIADEGRNDQRPRPVHLREHPAPHHRVPPRVRVAGAAASADAFAGARDDTSAPTSAERDEEAEKPQRSHAPSAGGRRGAALPPHPGQLAEK